MSSGYRRIEVEPKHSAAWPHGVGCEHCRNLAVCNECGASYKTMNDRGGLSYAKCANGRCPQCHTQVCGQADTHAPHREHREHRAEDRVYAMPGRRYTDRADIAVSNTLQGRNREATARIGKTLYYFNPESGSNTGWAKERYVAFYADYIRDMLAMVDSVRGADRRAQEATHVMVYGGGLSGGKRFKSESK